MLNFVIAFILVLVLLMLYKNYESKQETDQYSSLKKYLLRDAPIVKNQKPILWIYVPSVPNGRKIRKFGDGHSVDLNQPYLFLTLKSIIKANENSFTICIVDNHSFRKLIPGWEHDISRMSSPISCNMISLACAKILYIYGGLLVPISFLCFGDLIDICNAGPMVVCENRNKSSTYINHKFTTDVTFMGCEKENETMLSYATFMEKVISFDNTAHFQFKGGANEWVYEKVKEGAPITVITGEDIGVKMKGNPITIEDLFSEKPLTFSKNCYGVYIPMEEITNRGNYEWFSRLSKKEVMEGNTNIQKYILITSGSPKEISFWKVPDNKIIIKPTAP